MSRIHGRTCPSNPKRKLPPKDPMTEITESTGQWSYPVNTFENALEVARIIGDAGGANTEVSKAIIAQGLGTSSTSGNFTQRLATSRAYGLIDGGRNGYRLTEAAKRYLFPSSDEEKRLALLMLIKANPIFAGIIKRFDGTKIPTTELLSNVLFREFKVPESWKTRVARFFLKAAEQAGIIDSQGYLRYVAARQSLSAMPASSSSGMPDASEPASSGRTVTAPATMEASAGEMDVLVARDEGKTVRLETSPKLSFALWQRLDAHVKGLKPSKGQPK